VKIKWKSVVIAGVLLLLVACGSSTSIDTFQTSSTASSTVQSSSSKADTSKTVPACSSGINESADSAVSSHLSGLQLPAPSEGKDGDIYLNRITNHYFKKSAGTWNLIQPFCAYSTVPAGLPAYCTNLGNCGVLVDGRDEREYRWVKIGTGATAQVWMAENLAWLPSVNSTSDFSLDVAEYYVYDYDDTVVATAKATAYYSTYGVLYNWMAAHTACPSGWHLPTQIEWRSLEVYTGGTSYSLKAATLWSAHTGSVNNDDFSFSALPGGYHSPEQFFSLATYGYAISPAAFDAVGTKGFWWTDDAYYEDITHSDPSIAYSIYMGYEDGIYQNNYDNAAMGHSVRCLMD